MSSKDTFLIDKGVVEECKSHLSGYFHSESKVLKNRFDTIYKIFGLNDNMVSSKVGVDRSTMNRYRRGIWIPNTKMKILISQKISELSDYQIDSSVIWGDSIHFEKWRDKKLNGRDNENLDN